MDRQNYSNIAGVAYVQTQLSILKDAFTEMVPHKNTIDGMAGANTVGNLTHLAYALLGVTVPTTPVYSYDRGMDTLQTWYSYFHQALVSQSATNKFPVPEGDGNWGSETKRCFDRFFESLVVALREHRGPIYPTPRSSKTDDGANLSGTTSSFKVKTITQESDRFCEAEQALIAKALCLGPGSRPVTVGTLLLSNIIIEAVSKVTGTPLAIMIIRKKVTLCDTSRLPIEELYIEAFADNGSFDVGQDVMTEMANELLAIMKYSRINLCFHHSVNGTEGERAFQNYMMNTGLFHRRGDRTIYCK